MSTPTPRVAVAAAQLERLGGIVGDRERAQLEVADRDRLAVAGEAQARRRHRLAERAPGAAAHPDRQVVTVGERHRAADVVAVLVGDEHGIEIVGREPGARQP